MPKSPGKYRNFFKIPKITRVLSIFVVKVYEMLTPKCPVFRPLDYKRELLLIDQDMIVFDGYLFQVLSLPEEVTRPVSKALKTQEQMEEHDPATIRQLTLDTFWEKP